MCEFEINCHPSEFGSQVYADAVTEMILRNGYLR